MARYTAAEIRAKIKQFKTWYHNIELKGVSTNPANPSYPETRWRTIEPYVPSDLTGQTVLDLGCNAGYFSLKRNGAGEFSASIGTRRPSSKLALSRTR